MVDWHKAISNITRCSKHSNMINIVDVKKMSTYKYIFGALLFVVGSILAIDDAGDFPEIINPSHGFCHHWVTGVIMAKIGIVIMISVMRSDDK